MVYGLWSKIMLTLNKEQWDALMELKKNNHLKKIILILKEMHYEEAAKLSRDEFKLKVINGFEKARQYGFSLDEHIIEFIGLTFTWGDDFDISINTPWASEILSWKDAGPESKIRGLIERSEREIDNRL